ncbi:MAG: hypothetical protein EP301_12420, partial [Gammaproteobacteria bacterium]
GYYAHVSSGQLSLLSKREPVEVVIALLEEDSDAAAVALRERLELSQDVLTFAEDVLGLEVGGRYRSYVVLDREAVVWNLVAAPELSLTAHTWCYPFVGCAPYRGFFERAKAERARDSLAAKGLETHIGGVTAYSTLGWFDDPVLSTFVDLSEPDFIELLIRELAHSRIWVKDDAPFNESFASFVGREGAEGWFSVQGRAAEFSAHLAAQADWTRARELLQETRAALEVAYAAEETDAWKRSAKARIIDAAGACLAVMSETTGNAGYQRLAARLNNAYLASLATYSDQQPAFAVLFADAGGDWAAFFQAVDRLAELSAEAREARVEALILRSREEQVATHGDDQRTDEVQCEALAGHRLDAELAGGEHDDVGGGRDR